MSKLISDNVCANSANCEHCNLQQANDDDLTNLAKTSGKSIHEVTSAMEEMYRVQELCEERGIDVDDFMYKLLKKSAESNEDPNDPIHAHVAKMEATRNLKLETYN